LREAGIYLISEGNPIELTPVEHLGSSVDESLDKCCSAPAESLLSPKHIVEEASQATCHPKRCMSTEAAADVGFYHMSEEPVL
jgi:hypothetical protein